MITADVYEHVPGKGDKAWNACGRYGLELCVFWDRLCLSCNRLVIRECAGAEDELGVEQIT